MPLEIIRNNITNVSADAIVNTANPLPTVGYGTDSAIYEAAGREQLLKERRKIGLIAPGTAHVTPAFDLDARYIIHTVGPAWEGGANNEKEILSSCYRRSLDLASELKCESVAFPLISAGTYGFPKDVALKTAISEISDFLFSHDMTVYLVVFNKKVFELSGRVFDKVRSFIEDSDVYEPPEYDSRRRRSHHNMRYYTVAEREFETAEELSEAGSIDIDDMINRKAPTFQQYLFRIIDRKGLTDPEVYKKANIDKKLFSKIRSNVNYSPSKKTAIALAIALELSLDETKDLLLRAGFALSPSSLFDIIIEACISNGMTSIHEINCVLFGYGQPTLGV